jgi:hypothetical protein
MSAHTSPSQVPPQQASPFSQLSPSGTQAFSPQAPSAQFSVQHSVLFSQGAPSGEQVLTVAAQVFESGSQIPLQQSVPDSQALLYCSQSIVGPVPPAPSPPVPAPPAPLVSVPSLPESVPEPSPPAPLPPAPVALLDELGASSPPDAVEPPVVPPSVSVELLHAPVSQVARTRQQATVVQRRMNPLYG